MGRKVDVAVIGAGHAGLNAVKEIRKVTDNYALIRGGELGTTCARIGCMPSKVAMHLAEDALHDLAGKLDGDGDDLVQFERIPPDMSQSAVEYDTV